MKINSISELSDYLDYELAWRKKELFILDVQIESSKKGSPKQGTLIRSGITFLYAHWEGFVKQSSLAYLTYITSLKLKYGDIQPCLRAIGVKEKYQFFSQGVERNEALIKATAHLINGQNETFIINPEEHVDTQSNLNFKVLKNLLTVIGLDYSQYTTREQIIDGKLLYYRNHVAHGQRIDELTYDRYQEIFPEVIDLMGEFKTQIENAAVMSIFKIAGVGRQPQGIIQI